MKSLFLILFFYSVSIHAVTVTSLNIEWYGRGGEIEGQSEDEYRSERLRDFLFKQIPNSDIFVFQEITRPELLQKEFPELICKTYDVSVSRHQYVVMCVKQGILWVGMANYGVQIGNSHLRPAMIGQFQNQHGPSFKIIGMHLKAGPEKTDERLSQIKELSKSLDEGPTIIIGDFNSYQKDRTGKEKDDDQLINDLLSPYGLTQVPFHLFTYMGFNEHLFDRAWTKGVVVTSKNIYGPCSENSVLKPYSSKQFYKRFISDHCAVQVQFEIH